MKPKFTNSEVANIVDREGLDYAITCYMGADRIMDPKLAKLWQKANDILNEIEEILEESKENEEE
jgi:hypothetical protein